MRSTVRCMYRVIVFYDEAPDPDSYAEHVEVCKSILFFFNDPAPTEIYTLSLHDALPISFLDVTANATAQAVELNSICEHLAPFAPVQPPGGFITDCSAEYTLKIGSGSGQASVPAPDRKSTRLNSSH